MHFFWDTVWFHCCCCSSQRTCDITGLWSTSWKCQTHPRFKDDEKALRNTCIPRSAAGHNLGIVWRRPKPAVWSSRLLHRHRVSLPTCCGAMASWHARR